MSNSSNVSLDLLLMHGEGEEEEEEEEEESMGVGLYRNSIFVIACVGLVGNLLNITVLTRHRVRRTVEVQETAVYLGLLSLAVADLLFCLSVLPRTFVPDDLVVFADRTSFVFLYQVYSTGLTTTFILLSTWFIVMMAAIRYIGICHPLKARRMVSYRGSLTALASVVCFGFLVNCPSFWTFSVVELSRSNATTCYLLDLGLFSHRHRIGRVYLWTRATVGVFLPLVLLLFFNSRLISALRRSERFRRECSLSDRSRGSDSPGGTPSPGPGTYPGRGDGLRPAARNRLTTVLVAVIACFVVLVCPCELMDFLSHMSGIISPRDPRLFIVCRQLTNVLQVSNFSLNFLLYCVLNARFRRTLSALVFGGGRWQGGSCGRSNGTGHLPLRSRISRIVSTRSRKSIVDLSDPYSK